MQTANIMLAIGGDRGNTVPKYAISVAEIALLRAIHGEDAVFDVEPLETPAMDEGVVVSNRAELNRLRRVYDAKDADGNRVVDQVYPGAAARVFETLDEIDMPDEYFKPTERTAPIKAAAPATRSRAKSKAADTPADTPAADAGDLGDDGIKDMPSVMG